MSETTTLAGAAPERAVRADKYATWAEDDE